MRKTIMIVDNDSGIREKARKALEGKEFQVVEAESGIECLQLLHEGLKPKLIILEVEMPLMSGWKTVYEIHKDKAFSKIKTAFFAHKEAMKNCKKKPYCRELENHYVPKPFIAKELAKKVKKIIAG